MAEKYESFGIFLLKDDGSTINSIKSDCRYIAADITTAILKRWLRGGGMDVTWESLVDVLRKCKLISLADNIHLNLDNS